VDMDRTTMLSARAAGRAGNAAPVSTRRSANHMHTTVERISITNAQQLAERRL
jgi:hypothetical protein